MSDPRLYNKHHGDAPADAVYIGRGSPYGNRFVIGKDGDRAEVIRRFVCEQLPDMDVSELRGKSVICFCAPAPCHGTAIITKANQNRVLVFGGRNYGDRRYLFATLDAMHRERPITAIIEGEASGADRLARAWAESRGVAVLPYPAEWDDLECDAAVVKRSRTGKLYNAAAGPIRNTKMLREGRPDRAIGFPGGDGTKDMERQCWEYGLRPIRA
jgi:hypothetical protein